MKIHLIRHGKTEANEKRLYCGNTDLPLSKSGADAISAFAAEGIYPDSELYFSSGLERANQTLRIIYGDVPVKTEPRISEYIFGEFEMKSYETLKNDKRYIEWIEDTEGTAYCPGGESRKQFNERTVKGFENILNAVSESGVSSAAVVCHGGTIAAVMEYLFPHTKNFYEWQPETGRGYTVAQCVNPDGEKAYTYIQI